MQLFGSGTNMLYSLDPLSFLEGWRGLFKLKLFCLKVFFTNQILQLQIVYTLPFKETRTKVDQLMYKQ